MLRETSGPTSAGGSSDTSEVALGSAMGVVVSEWVAVALLETPLDFRFPILNFFPLSAIRSAMDMSGAPAP